MIVNLEGSCLWGRGSSPPYVTSSHLTIYDWPSWQAKWYDYEGKRGESEGNYFH